MPTYRRQDLTGQGYTLPDPPVAELVGLRPFVRGPVVATMRAQDKVAACSRRQVLSYGLAGDSEWRVPNIDPTTLGSRTHPDRSTWYTVARGRVEVTPGCFLRAVLAYVPSGMTQRSDGSSGFEADGAVGHVRVTVVWTDAAAATETSVHELILEPSQLEYAAEDAAAGGLWRTMHDAEIPLIAPPDLDDDAELTRWCEAAPTATITVEHLGSPRVVSFVLHEVPYAFAGDVSALDRGRVSALHGPGSPDAPWQPLTYLQSEASPSIGTTGTLQAVASARAQAEVLSPCLLQWTAYSETSATPTATIAAVTAANNGTTFVSLVNSSHTGTGPAAYSSSLPGWSVSCGGYARRLANCDVLVLRDRIAVVPVLVRVYGRGVTAGTSTVRVQTALHSYVDVTLPVAGSASWHRAFGYLEVGITPEQPIIGQVFVNHVGASGSLSVEAVEVYVSPPEQPAEV